MVSYDDRGFYGHPDHIQAHRVAWRAFQLAGDPGVSADPGASEPGGAGRAGAPRPGAPWPVAKFYATAMPRSVLATAIDLSGRDGVATPAGFIAEADADTLPFGAADDQVSTEIDGSAYLAAKTAAMRAHATQIIVHEPFFALSNWVGQRILAREYYTLVAGPRGPAGPDGRETDLFAGLD
jgi:N-acetyl-1-D-myo-inositol-2-amino-2-deoxy-alpha-D-glucopyranoside deacetylase